MAIDYSELTEEQLAVIEDYCKDDMKKLKKVCYPIWGNKGLPSCYHDDLYDDAMKVLVESVVSYNPDSKASFKTFLTNNINLSQREWYRNNFLRAKRNNLELDESGKIKNDECGKPIIIKNVSFDANVGEDEIDLKGKIASDFKVEDEVNFDFETSEKVDLFLSKLSDVPKKITKMIMIGMSSSEIKEKLNITDKEYKDYWKMITVYENKRILYKENNTMEDNEMNTTTISTEDIAESYKNTSYSIDSISKQLQKKRIRDDHILQRHSGQWKGFAKSELISDILRGKSLTQIIISEEIKNGLRMQWLIDGKQRCTTLDDFLHDGFPISKNVKNYNIRYQTTKTDDDGYEVLNEDGFTEMEFKEFDIRGKKFSQLPEELQEIFRDRQIPVLYNMNCTKKDIADDIARFNRSRPMNVAQNGWLGLDECFAELVGNISKMPFFQKDFKGTTYTLANHTSGAIRRVIVEAIMVSDFIGEFNDFDKMCEFLSEEASDSNFTEFYSLVERLTLICNEDVSKMFNTTDSFLWLGLFSKFSSLGIDDQKFIDFMIEFESSMKDIKVDVTYDGVDRNSFDDLCTNPITKKSRATKDRNMVIAKMKLLETLMLEYLHINENDLEETNTLDFVRENVKSDATEDDVEFYSDILDDLTVEVDNDTKLLDKHNRPSLVALVGYACENECDEKLTEWIKQWFAANTIYILNQKRNYEIMLQNFQKGQVA